LNESGVGHWVRPAPINLEGATLKPGERGETVTRLQRALAAYGYRIAESGTYDELIGRDGPFHRLVKRQLL
jgi:N-acetylmuramoyl-L-alanine amidase